MKCDADDAMLYEQQYIDNGKSLVEKGVLKYICRNYTCTQGS